MYKTAPRYLSGVSVFYGDDITRRNVTGEIAFIVGQAIKGPRTPIVLRSPENAIPIFGKGSPVVKALFQFWDGYLDSPKAQPLQLVALRTGGQVASVITPFGVTIDTVDAYTGIENDFYLYINNSSTTQTIKAWDSLKQKVYDSSLGIDTGYITVTGTLDASGGVIGKDIDNDPFATPATFKTILTPEFNIGTTATFINPNGSSVTSTYSSSSNTSAVEIVLTTDQKASVNLDGGWITVQSTNAAVVNVTQLQYTSATITVNGAVFTVDGEVSILANPYTSLGFVSSYTLILGDSQLSTDPRIKYEQFRNALAEIEQYTPDYIIPGGVYFDEADTYSKTMTYTTTLVAQVANGATSILVDGAAAWQPSGNVDLFDGTFTDQLTYSSKSASGVDYIVSIESPSGTLASPVATGASTVSVVTSEQSKWRNSGYVKINGTYLKYISVDSTVNNQVTLTLASPAATSYMQGTPSVKSVGAVGTSYAGYVVSHYYTYQAKRELGIGYVKETDIGGLYTFQWADTPTAGYNLAHFGYLLANFCSEAAIGFNTPLAGMNVDVTDLSAAGFSRSSIVKWIGSYPSYRTQAGDITQVTQVLSNGVGLLGNAVTSGTTNYNRTGFTDIGNGVYADPGFGLLLTEEGFIDGAIARDTFGNVVDLGKFMVVGAGLLNFTNASTINTYIDACGIYALGMLAGKSQEQGLSFSRVGGTSNTTVGVVVHRKYYNDLAHCKYLVVSRERGLGWVLNNGDAIARSDSGYKLISTTRIIKYIVEGKRSLLSGFIGRGLNQYNYEAARTKLADSFKNDIKNGLINGYNFDLQIENTAAAIGKLYLKIAINPPFELTQVTIDTIIDRTVTTV